MSEKKSFKPSNALINALLFIVLGVLLCVFRARVLNWAMTAVGVLLIVVGALNIINGELTEGVIMAAVGAIVILGGWLFVDIILLILGVAIAVKGVLDLLKAVEGKNIPAVIASAITIAVGVLLVVSKWALLDWFFIVLGVILIVDGVLMGLGKKI